MYCIGRVDGGREGSNCCMCRLLLDISPPLSCHLSPLDSWTHRALKKWDTFYLACHLELGS